MHNQQKFFRVLFIVLCVLWIIYVLYGGISEFMDAHRAISLKKPYLLMEGFSFSFIMWALFVSIFVSYKASQRFSLKTTNLIIGVMVLLSVGSYIFIQDSLIENYIEFTDPGAQYSVCYKNRRTGYRAVGNYYILARNNKSCDMFFALDKRLSQAEANSLVDSLNSQNTN
ncbi:MAG: hypothetical protein V4736_11045 [Bdellovibrionota bacterium]